MAPMAGMERQFLYPESPASSSPDWNGHVACDTSGAKERQTEVYRATA
jgi:hypothetical protein